jgi:hypothetical protein
VSKAKTVVPPEAKITRPLEVGPLAESLVTVRRVNVFGPPALPAAPRPPITGPKAD